MSDQENQTVSFQGAQPEVVQPLPEKVEGEQGAVNKSEVTNEAENLTESISKEVAKQVQGFTDRLTAHIDKRFNEYAGKQTQAIASDNPQPVGNQINDTESVKAAIASQVITDLGIQAMKEVGVDVLTNDPEASMIDTSSPSAYIQSVRKAAEKKMQRINTPSEGRLAGVPGGQYENEDIGAISAELAKLQQNPTKNIERRKELRAKLARLTKQE